MGETSVTHPTLAGAAMTADPLCTAAQQHHHAGAFGRAEALYRAALQLDPGHAESLYGLGKLVHASGDSEQAVRLLEAAVARKPRNAHYRDALGLALGLAGRNREALAAHRDAVRLEKSSAGAQYNLGRALAAAGEHAEAAQCFRRAVSIDPTFAGAYNSLGNALFALGQPARAAEAFQRALELEPGAAQIHLNLATMLLHLGRDAEAAAAIERALAITPDHAEALELLGRACQRSGDSAPQEQALRRAVAHAPGNVDLVAKLALFLDQQDRVAEAGPCFRQVLDLAPRAPLSHANYGIWLRTMGDLAGSEAQLRAGLALAPTDRFLHHALSHTLLSMGQMREGFAELEWREIPARYPAPAWNGAAAPGRSLLIMIEQGRGDVLQFLRYVPLAARRVRVVLETAPSLRRLAAGVQGVAAVFYPNETIPEHDMVCPLLSLPLLLGLDEAPLGMDPEHPYLRPDPGDAAHWAARLAALPGRKIGLVWAGSPELSLDRRRSVPPALFNELRRDDISFISLQKDPAAKPDLPLTDWTGELRDFADTAALITHLDLVISVDTAVAHLAGALGKPVWLLNRFDADWRWLRAGDRSAWYPSLRQFRQPGLGDWDSVMQKLQAALRDDAGSEPD
jgi:tetratricopeptide (TPR) repeat protein